MHKCRLIYIYIITHILLKIFILVWLRGPVWMRLGTSVAYEKTCLYGTPGFLRHPQKVLVPLSSGFLCSTFPASLAHTFLGQVTKYLAMAEWVEHEETNSRMETHCRKPALTCMLSFSLAFQEKGSTLKGLLTSYYANVGWMFLSLQST